MWAEMLSTDILVKIFISESLSAVLMPEFVHTLHIVELQNSNWKGCGEKRSWTNFGHHTCICLEGLTKITKPISQDIRCRYRDSNWALPESKSEALSPEPACSVTGS
jgi:hypothetical protein